MANIEQQTKKPSDLSQTAGSVGRSPDNVPTLTTGKVQVPVSAAAGTAAPVKPTLVQLGTTPTPPQQKRYNASNINKKFLEKNSTVPAIPPSSSASSASKPAVRPQVQTTTTHSKLVTAKLTATSQSSTTGPGWSRPSSATPPVAGGSSAGSPNGTGHSPTSSISNPPSTVGGAGKVIQPQPRSIPSFKDGPGNKPVWGNVKAAAQRSDSRVKDEFPTAAEVAQVKHKLVESKEAAQALLAANAQARLEEADTFRGVHLDPNAHHWDEMEEDDNFLNGVIEFGDGRQYKIEAAQSPPHSLTSLQEEDSSSNIPVSKEERFADDFDRSWPRSRTSPRIRDLPPSHTAGSTTTTTNSISPVTASPQQEHSRVLFNERSNRLEPYSGARSGYHSKRGGGGGGDQHGGPPNESRGRDVQVLQKEFRGRGGADDRRGERRESNASQQSAQSPWFTQQTFNPHARESQQQQQQDNHSHNRGRRGSNNMGPPPPPPPSRRPTSNSRLDSSGSIGRMSSRESRSGRHPSQSPALSHASVALSPSESVVLPSAALTESPTVDIDTLRKEAMHDAASRAKQRRQQEEEEREKQKERARKKAAELEDKMEKEKRDKLRAEEAAREAEAVKLIEEAVNIAADQPPSSPDLRRGNKQKPPSLNGPTFSDFSGKRRPSLTSVTSQFASSGADTWRRQQNPVSAPPTKSTTSFLVPPPSALDQSLAEENSSQIEVVDFSEVGKLMGVVPDVPPPPRPPADPSTFSPTKILTSRPRPTASDFLDDRPVVDNKPATDTATWRSSRILDPLPPDAAGDEKTSSSDAPSAPPPTTTKDESLTQVVTVPASSHPPTQKTPRSQTFHKEASMSALNDVMSRIKGALDVMHSEEHHSTSTTTTQPDSSLAPRLSPPKERWLAPALRVRTVEAKPTEIFDVTGAEFAHSPLAQSQSHTIKIPKSSSAREPVPKRLLILSTKIHPVRWDILSFDPQVEGMNKRDLSLNDILFPRMGGKRKFGAIKYNVVIPRLRQQHGGGPRVNIPPKLTHSNSSNNSLGPFGKATAADNASSWRKSPITPKLEDGPAAPPPLDTTSLPSETSIDAASKGDSLVTPVRRSQPKMPAGSSVAFYRDSKIVEDGPLPLVSFIVTSELEDSKKLQSSSSTAPSNPTASPAASSSLSSVSSPSSTSKTSPSLLNGVKSALAAGFLSSPMGPEKKLEDSGEVTTSHHSWARSAISKESPARGVPDPEHLKAVWSQTSNKNDSKPVNSLEGLTDDLSAIPFSLQDVKSEGGTPPPPIPPSTSRITLHDMTRAFQQVPTSTSSTSTSSLRPTISPPLTNAPVARPPPSYSYPANQPMRPPYPPYPPQMMSHTPSPIMYPMQGSPIPARMTAVNGAPMYSQPVWVPMPTTNPQNPVGLMRPSPYPSPMMYHSPAGQPMYMQPMPNMQNPQQQQNDAQNRARGMHSNMISPVISHAMAAPHPGMPMYASSPVLMHAGRVPQNQPPPPGQAQPPAATNQTHTYSMPPSTSFSRATW